MSVPEPPPAGIAAFRIIFPVQKGNADSISTGFVVHAHPAGVTADWSFDVATTSGEPAQTQVRMPLAAMGGMQEVDEQPEFTPPPLSEAWMRIPAAEPAERLAAIGGIPGMGEQPEFVTPPACEAWMRVPAAEPAERFVDFAYADTRPSSSALLIPGVTHQPASVPPPVCEAWMRVPAAEAAERFINVACAGILPSTSSLRFPAVTHQPVSVPPPVCETWMRVPAAEAAERFLNLACAGVQSFAAQLRLPEASHIPLAEMDEQPDSVPPPVCEAWMRVPAAEAAERFLNVACVGLQPFAGPLHLPGFGDVPITPIFVREISEFAPSLRADIVASSVFAVLNSRPAPYLRPLSALRFSVHTIDDLSARPSAGAEAPRPAGPVTAPAPVPVEAMPSVPAFVAQELPFDPQFAWPTVRSLTAQVLPQARAVAGPLAQPVETMPSAGHIRIAAVPMRSAVRGPSMGRLQPASDPGEPLAAPVFAPPPAAVESLPAIAAFQAKPLPATPQIILQAFSPDVRAEFPVPVVPLAAPQAGERSMPAAHAGAPEPLSRIAGHPEGAQPERPAPAIPQPGLIPLEYYSHRIASAPLKRVEPLQPKVAIRQVAWAVRPALNRIGEPRKNRLVEQIFGKPGAAGAKRVNVSVLGKIAATVMVGMALWTGSRVADLSSHTEQLRAEVAASERTVTVAEARNPEANFGKGPVGNLRRAIAQRAATEITDTFHGGMAAWGAQPKTLAAGWKRHPEGYVSVGEMALFQPSIQYTDYRMEFYGQIEDKSMGWVVRAQDKKNYYAMKFKVIETGLRPMIAMVHYGVVNGKAGHRVETPLSVMIHNNQPYHVAVDVRGNRFTASIEGEPVESWTDDAAARGGVGFFADAGEKARLYWMRLSRNQDWLGRVCAYMSGDGRVRQQTAELWAPEIPHQKPEPVNPRGADLALAAALDRNDRPGRAKTAKQRRTEAWIS